jgi:hypothetical protein
MTNTEPQTTKHYSDEEIERIRTRLALLDYPDRDRVYGVLRQQQAEIKRLRAERDELMGLPIAFDSAAMRERMDSDCKLREEVAALTEDG